MDFTASHIGFVMASYAITAVLIGSPDPAGAAEGPEAPREAEHLEAQRRKHCA